jgi:hypothetical protein
MPKTDLQDDHHALPDWAAVRRYFAKFERIIAHSKAVAETVPRRGKLAGAELAIIEDYLGRLSRTFTALSYKHLFAGRPGAAQAQAMEIDRRESGFPIYAELLQMANDALQAQKRLDGMPEADTLKAEMVRHILSAGETPSQLHYTMSQRLYYQALAGEKLFLPQNDPEALWLGDIRDKDRRRYLLHWATYDSQLNIPTIYLAIVEDTGKKPLLKDERRWPAVQSHLMAQSVGSLKMVTIGQGLDVDFDDLHPKFVRRMHIGPMYSHTFTTQSGPLREVLADASGRPGLDWALTWTTETLISGKTREEKLGWFGTVEREVFKLDKDVLEDEGPGATKVEHSLILPERAYQVLRDRNPPGLRGVKRYVVNESGRVLAGM